MYLFAVLLLNGPMGVPQPWLDKKAFMEEAYQQAASAGATHEEIIRLKQIAYGESRGNPRVCVLGGCGAFQHEIHTLVPRRLRKLRFAHRVVKWLLTNSPRYAGTTALDLLQRCEALSGEHWRCCYGGAYRPSCRVKWDQRFRETFESE